MTPDSIQSFLAAPWKHFSDVASTNQYLHDLPEKERVSGYTCSADQQSKGRGRRGRSWSSPPGGLYLSILMCTDSNPEKWNLLPLMTAVAVARSLTLLAPGLPVLLKWPNDLLIGGRKAGGILLESKVGPSSKFVAGIGINVDVSLENLPDQPLFPATSLQQEIPAPPGIRALAETCRSIFFEQYRIWETQPSEIVSQWLALSASYGKKVTFLVDGTAHRGIDRGITPMGNIIIEAGGLKTSFDSLDMIHIGN